MRWIASLLIIFTGGFSLGCGNGGDAERSGAGPAPAWRTTPAPRNAPRNAVPNAPRTAPAPPPTASAEHRVNTGRGPYLGPLTRRITAEPAIRVRVRTSVAELELTHRGPLRVAAAATTDPKQVHRYTAPLRVRRVNETWEVRDAAGRVVRWPTPRLLIECDGGEAIEVGEQAYPNRLVLVPDVNARTGNETGLIDAINHVPLETYLAGVIEKELYASWPLEAFKAQAVAARSYALWEMTIASDRAYDLESTVASQAYIGRARNAKSVEAVQATRGECLTYRGRVLPAFYSSSTGGLGQDATLAFPDRVEELPPLQAREHGAWDKDSPQWRWGPVDREVATLSRRVAGWGKARGHPVAELGQIAGVRIAARNRVGRPSVFEVRDTAGRRFTLACEAFRNACNHTLNGKLPLPRGDRLLSSHVQPQVIGGTVRFAVGRGFGHGVGMSQWGARTMAAAGHGYTSILGFYYPGATVQQLYR